MRITRLHRSHNQRSPHAGSNTGAPPGTLHYTGQQEMSETHVHLTHFGADKADYSHELAVDEIPSLPTPESGVTWYDVRGLHNLELIAEIGRKYQVHPLALEDIVDVEQRPKMAEYDQGVLLQVKAFEFNEATRELSTEQISIYLHQGTVLTFQEDAGDLFASVRQRLETATGRIRARGADYLAYALIDNIIDHYFTVLDKLEDALDSLEGSILDDPEPFIKRRIHNLKLSLITMRKNTGPAREMATQYGASEHALITPGTQLFVRDLKDHLFQVTDLVETYRDVANGLYDLYVSELTSRTNSVVQILTIVSTIFMPLSFLAGLYGMNFVNIPELRNPYGYFILLGVMVVIVLAMFMWFRKKGWLNPAE